MITYEHLQKIFDLVGYALSDNDFSLLVRFADETGHGNINAAELANQIIYAREIAPQFDVNKWIVASRYLEGNDSILQTVQQHLDVLKDIMQSEFIRAAA
jgi:hypothetical protein